MAAEPLVGGIRLGGLVEINGLTEQQIQELGEDVNNELGQVIQYAGGEVNKFYVMLLCGFSGYFDPQNVRAASERKRPGEGGDARSFDIFMGPRTDGPTLGNEIASCIFEKGFCAMKVCHSAKMLEGTLTMLRDMGEEGSLSRFCEEVEENYLGTSCRGKVAWMDVKNKDFAADPNLGNFDANLSYIAQVIQPFSFDLLDAWVDERTPALVCLSLTDDEVPEYPFPEADDATLGNFLTTYRRTLLRVVHFMGPGTASVDLSSKDTPKAGSLPKVRDNCSLECTAGTILIFRPDIYEYSCDAPEETLFMMTNFLDAAPSMEYSSVQGDTAWLSKLTEGPPPPPAENNVHVVNATSRLPGCWDEAAAYFAGLSASSDTVIEIPMMRWDVNMYYSADDTNFQPWQTTSKHQSLVEGADMFDNKFFEISNAESAGMDPVQRLILECGSQSMAMNGYTKKQTNRKSVHAGFAVGNDKLDWMTCEKSVEIGGAIGGTSTVLAIIANRFSFVFNMKGPNFVCDTACSASLSSTHCARLMIMNRNADPLDFFITMGAHLCLSGGPFIGCSQSHMSSSTGRCFTFNASANGYLRGEGVSGYMMKWGNYRDESWAILRATMVGQDGRSASLTAPNGPAQEELVTRALKDAQMTPPESTVWECHGTGTSLGDPIEVGAVRKVQIRMPRSEPLMITSNKTNIGHLEGGAAMGGMVKCILQCDRCKCCSTVHLRTLNPHLEHAAFDAIFQTESACYAYAQGHSQVSSFGFGGTNAHGIFWGENLAAVPNVEAAWAKRVALRPPPEVRPMGRDPEDWEADFPDIRNLKKGAKLSIKMGPGDNLNEPIRWQLEEDGPEEEADEDTFYSITGNFNEWSDDRMAVGDIDGVFIETVQVPANGVVEFQFLKDGSADQVLAPAAPMCYRKTEQIIGPEKDLTNKWVINADPGRDVKIELFAKQGRLSVMWLVEKD